MIVYPVLDLKGGLVVRGQGGERESYRPIRSAIASSPEPIAVARAFRDAFGLARIYLADLDALAGAPPAIATLRELIDDGFELLVDAGVRSAGDAERIASAGAGGVIAALETLPNPDALASITRAVDARRVIFSLDLKAGRILGDREGWPFDDPFAIAEEAARSGVSRILVLDLAQVGSARGPGHLDLLGRLARNFPGIELLSGGGVRSTRDLELFAEAGVRGVLVASALHDGAITRSEIERTRE